ncbi:MAG: translation elongation factor 4 [Campylobacterales bacterium]|nr:translation elongation factor 4 [Campylobacterales bacterium]
MKNIRNFSIIAHIDHGKSTLADRIIQDTGAVSDREMDAQLLDGMDIEKERGITIKAQSVRLKYTKDGEEYILNLIDTPGHVDFSHEVSKSLISSEGALLVVDAAQGVEAQTIANVYLALDNDLEIIPVINKVDLPSAEVDRVKGEIEQTIGLDCENANLVSAKSGLGIKNLLDTIVDLVPPPEGDPEGTPKALIYDSWFDSYLGALALVRVFDGEFKKGQKVKVMGTGKTHDILDLMYPHPIKDVKTPTAKAGEIAIVVMGLKNVGDVAVGDTITDGKHPATEPVATYEEAKPFVFAGLYPIETDQFEALRDALDKLSLNDSSISYEPETSVALGYGFRVGFLGMLHMEVIKERLEREFNIDLIATAPTVTYEVIKTNGETVYIENPTELPEVQNIETIKEPYARATVIVPKDYVGPMITLMNDKRGVQEKMDYLGEDRVMLVYAVPMNEIIVDFYDKLKTLTKGYASFDYELIDNQEGDLVKLDVKVAGEVVDALSLIVPRTKADSKGRDLCKSLKELIDRQLFEVAIQASIGNKIIARETVKSVGKNVTAKCYGGDITRKRKLLEKQKAGKKRMKAIGKVNLPQEAFLAVLKID